LLFDERAEGHEGRWASRTLIRRTHPLIEQCLRLVPRRNLRHRTQHLPPPNLSNFSAFQQHVFPPPTDPHLAAFAALEQLTFLKSSTSHVDLLRVRLALLSGGVYANAGKAERSTFAGPASRCGALGVDVRAEIGTIEAEVLPELDKRQPLLRAVTCARKPRTLRLSGNARHRER
jgi:hypothetical protein